MYHHVVEHLLRRPVQLALPAVRVIDEVVHVGDLLVRVLPHHAPDGLHHLVHRLGRLGEHQVIELLDVDALLHAPVGGNEDIAGTAFQKLPDGFALGCADFALDDMVGVLRVFALQEIVQVVQALDAVIEDDRVLVGSQVAGVDKHGNHVLAGTVPEDDRPFHLVLGVAYAVPRIVRVRDVDHVHLHRCQRSVRDKVAEMDNVVDRPQLGFDVARVDEVGSVGNVPGRQADTDFAVLSAVLPGRLDEGERPGDADLEIVRVGALLEDAAEDDTAHAVRLVHEDGIEHLEETRVLVLERLPGGDGDLLQQLLLADRLLLQFFQFLLGNPVG